MRSMIRALVLLFASAVVASAQTYPNRPVRLIVGFTPGGATDIISRILGQQLTESLGKPVIVENRPGASGMIGAELVAKAQPDGYMLYMASQTTHAVAPYMYTRAPYDPVKDFAAVSVVVNNPLLMVTHPSLNIASVKDLIALAKARPGQLSFATGGIGASGHMAAELFKSMVKVDMVAVHYKGDSAALTDVLGGQVPLMFVNISAVLQYVRAGKLRGIAVTSGKRSTIAPDFPTVAESGLSGYDVVTWFGVLAPATTPKEIITRLNTEIVRALQLASVREQIARQGFEIVADSPEQFTLFLKEENVRWARVVKESGARAE